MRELSIETLAAEGLKLLQLETDELYATLGGQLLAHNLPTRVAGIVSYFSAVRTASDAKSLYEQLPIVPSLSEWGRGLGIICDELKREGLRFMEEVKAELSKSICNEDVLHLSDEINQSSFQVVIMVVGATLRMPREFDPISVTIAALLLKIGLRKFCDDAGGRKVSVRG